ncbi:hypothetical protein ABZY68_16440 [Streptomyces sp. NPDC006482]|uniref:hypothetical protein n=1 Tax=Streptomyces sp. NPDC006482 TaxID=3154306 RepID=UPI0033AB9DC0
MRVQAGAAGLGERNTPAYDRRDEDIPANVAFNTTTGGDTAGAAPRCGPSS